MGVVRILRLPHVATQHDAGTVVGSQQYGQQTRFVTVVLVLFKDAI